MIPQGVKLGDWCNYYHPPPILALGSLTLITTQGTNYESPKVRRCLR